jgi:NAD(P)-dependent dehydrogenase (short-subunit alcohol dehydrogenase family)
MFASLKKFISRQFIFPEVHIPHSDDLSGTVAIITGASRGIGKAIAEMILAKGGKVAAVSRSLSDLEAAFPNHTDSLIAIEADITTESGVAKIIEATLARLNSVNVLINNAALNIEKPFHELTTKEFEDTMNTNVKAAFMLSHAALPELKKAQGVIINIGSKISHNTNVGPHKVLYATSKYALEGFSLALSKELKSEGVRVTCLMPGTVNTFVSLNAKDFLSPQHVADVVSFIIRHRDMDFESIIMKSKDQHI